MIKTGAKTWTTPKLNKLGSLKDVAAKSLTNADGSSLNSKS